jgi:hypothetical protein
MENLRYEQRQTGMSSVLAEVITYLKHAKIFLRAHSCLIPSFRHYVHILFTYLINIIQALHIRNRLYKLTTLRPCSKSHKHTPIQVILLHITYNLFKV